MTTQQVQQTCPKRGQWCSVRLVDENGNSKTYAGLKYAFFDRQGEAYKGVLDGDGFAKVANFYCGPLRLDLSSEYQNADKWYAHLQIREKFSLPLTELQVAAEQTPKRKFHEPDFALQRATAEKAEFYRVEVRDFVKKSESAHLPDADTTLSHRPSAFLMEECEVDCMTKRDQEKPGIALAPNRHHVLEVKALRAYRPVLSHDKAFCAVNAYHLALMTTLAYGPFNEPCEPGGTPTAPPYAKAGSIGNVLQSKLACAVAPTLFNDAGPYHLLYEEVPYSKRLEVVPYDPERYQQEARDGWEYPEQVHFFNHKNGTQAFITHNEKYVLISIRGTAAFTDVLRDLDARQVNYVEGDGQAHRGFYNAFESMKEFIDSYLRAFFSKEQTLFICGHSLGGAIALLLAEWLRREYSQNIQLYTYGSPRAGDATFVKSAAELTHHRLVNHNDPVPGVPSTWMDAEWKLALPGTAMLVASASNPLLGTALLLGGLLNLRGDKYQHHGEQRHFMPRKAKSDGYSSILWQPGCAALEEKTCAEFAGAIDLQGDMPSRQSLLGQALSSSEHSSNGGYSRAALTTLLRWRAATDERGGTLFTEEERKKISKQITPLQDELARWQPGTYTQFRHNLRTRTHPRLDKLSETELRSLHHDGWNSIRALQSEQQKGLSKAQKRLLAQSQVPVTTSDVFGDQAKHPDLTNILQQWLALADVQKAQRLAKVEPSTPTQVA